MCCIRISGDSGFYCINISRSEKLKFTKIWLRSHAHEEADSASYKKK